MHPLLYKETPAFTIEKHILYMETPYYGTDTFPYYRRKSLTNKEIIQGSPLL